MPPFKSKVKTNNLFRLCGSSVRFASSSPCWHWLGCESLRCPQFFYSHSSNSVAIDSFLPPFSSAANIMLLRIYKSWGFKGLESCRWIRTLCNSANIIVSLKENILPSLDGVVSWCWGSWVFVTECYHWQL